VGGRGYVAALQRLGLALTGRPNGTPVASSANRYSTMKSKRIWFESVALGTAMACALGAGDCGFGGGNGSSYGTRWVRTGERIWFGPAAYLRRNGHLRALRRETLCQVSQNCQQLYAQLCAWRIQVCPGRWGQVVSTGWRPECFEATCGAKGASGGSDARRRHHCVIDRGRELTD
jgi:hypothetical protein